MMLNSLVIKNFRMLEDFTVEKLGRVNLIVGKNNSGKSTVLEALRIYAGNANRDLLVNIAESRDEKFQLFNEEKGGGNVAFPYEDLFFERKYPKYDIAEIIIGDSTNELIISRVFFLKNQETHQLSSPLKKVDKSNLKDIVCQGISAQKGNFYQDYYDEGYSYWDDSNEQPYINYSFIPTQFISIDELANEWDNIVYTSNEKIVIDALKIIVPDFEHLVFVNNERSTTSRIAKVKLANLPKPVPLKSLGDGMLRILQIAIKLVSAQGGFLLIDEFENGLHYSVQENVWRLLFEMAEKLDIQVFATTHSWDCIESFATVALQNPEIEGVLFRMGKSVRTSNKGQVIATIFSGEELKYITQSNMEIR